MSCGPRIGQPERDQEWASGRDGPEHGDLVGIVVRWQESWRRTASSMARSHRIANGRTLPDIIYVPKPNIMQPGHERTETPQKPQGRESVSRPGNSFSSTIQGYSSHHPAQPHEYSIRLTVAELSLNEINQGQVSEGFSRPAHSNPSGRRRRPENGIRGGCRSIFSRVPVDRCIVYPGGHARGRTSARWRRRADGREYKKMNQ